MNDGLYTQWFKIAQQYLGTDFRSKKLEKSFIKTYQVMASEIFDPDFLPKSEMNPYCNFWDPN